MGKTDTERLQRWRKKEMAKGRKNISVLLSTAATEKLDGIQTRSGESIAAVMERLLLGKSPASPVVGSTLDMEAIEKIRTGKMPAEKEQVKNLITELRLNERLSHKQIAEYLIIQEVPTISGRGHWQAGSVGKLLKKWEIP